MHSKVKADHDFKTKLYPTRRHEEGVIPRELGTCLQRKDHLSHQPSAIGHQVGLQPTKWLFSLVKRDKISLVKEDKINP